MALAADERPSHVAPDAGSFARTEAVLPASGDAIGAAAAARRSRRAPTPTGLVPFSETSPTRGVEPEIVVPLQGARVRRMRRGVKAAARAVQEVALAGAQQCVPLLVTLTYREINGWAAKHVSDCVERIRLWGIRQNVEIPYVWVSELQKRGAVHYHVVLWLPRRLHLPSPDRAGWWKHGMTNVKRCTSPVGYLLKYASKGSDGQFPKGLRLFGSGGLTAAGRAVRSWLCLPTWLHEQIRTGFARVLRLPGGLWLVEATGELFRSPYEFVRLDKEARTVVFRRRSDEAPTPSMQSRG